MSTLCSLAEFLSFLLLTWDTRAESGYHCSLSWNVRKDQGTERKWSWCDHWGYRKWINRMTYKHWCGCSVVSDSDFDFVSLLRFVICGLGFDEVLPTQRKLSVVTVDHQECVTLTCVFVSVGECSNHCTCRLVFKHLKERTRNVQQYESTTRKRINRLREGVVGGGGG